MRYLLNSDVESDVEKDFAMKHFWLFSIALCTCLLAGATSASADGSYSIEGTIQFFKIADITVLLLTEDEMKNMTQNSYKLHLKPDENALASGKMPFQLTNVPAGSYVLLAYQDNNNNEKLDKKFFTFTEPWGTFRPQRPGMGYKLKFNDLNFNLSKDIHNIKIQLTR